jgi:SET domain-containing protein
MRRIPKGTRIIEYTGERISPEEGDERYDDDGIARPHTFLFTVDRSTVIDAARGGNRARFINHSCDPNCTSIIEAGRVFIEAIRDIPRGAELTYDYRLHRKGRWRPEWAERYACHCGAKKCRGTILLPRRRGAKRGGPTQGGRKRPAAATKRTSTARTARARRG